MIHIAICDDEKLFTQKLEKEVLGLFRSNGVDCKIILYTRGKDFYMSHLECEFDLVFLDIDMPELSGIDIAADFRRRGLKTELVFVSSHSNFVFEVIKYKPFRFIRKEKLQTELPEAIADFCEQLRDDPCFVHFELDRQQSIYEDVKKIVCFCSARHDIFLLNNRNENVKLAVHTYSLEQLEESLKSSGYIRVHKSYLVNYRYIHQILKDKVSLKGFADIPLSHKRAASVKKQYQLLNRRGDAL